MMRGVYLIRHEPSGRCYVGGSTDVDYRWKAHRETLNRGVHMIPQLQADWSRDGAAAFAWELVESVPEYGSRQPPYCYAVEFAEQRCVDRLVADAVPLYNRSLRFVSLERMATEARLSVGPREIVLPLAEKRGTDDGSPTVHPD
jgi:hypothetical protein